LGLSIQHLQINPILRGKIVLSFKIILISEAGAEAIHPLQDELATL
jgi:hypothetical protein